MSDESINDDELNRMMWGSAGVRSEWVSSDDMTVVEGFAAGIVMRDGVAFPVLVIRKPGDVMERFVITPGIIRGKFASSRMLVLGMIAGLTKVLQQLEGEHDADRRR